MLKVSALVNITVFKVNTWLYQAVVYVIKAVIAVSQLSDVWHVLKIISTLLQDCVLSVKITKFIIIKIWHASAKKICRKFVYRVSLLILIIKFLKYVHAHMDLLSISMGDA